MAGGSPRDPVQGEDWPVDDGDFQQADGIQAFKLGRLVLLGPGEGSVGVKDTQNLVKFLSAFEVRDLPWRAGWHGQPEIDSADADDNECTPPSPNPL
jgi:hypothetical protein